MKTTYTTLMESKYYSAAFNNAIFDGPIRIYFSQLHEAEALRTYIFIQKKLSSIMEQLKEVSKLTGGSVKLMIYPTSAEFSKVFQETDELFDHEQWNQDLMIGINGPMSQSELESFVDSLELILLSWRPVAQSGSLSLVELC